MSSLNLTNNFPSSTTSGIFTNGSGNANNSGCGDQGAVGYGRNASWNGRGSNSIGISGGFQFLTI
jgi:hypothetical protein